MNWLRRFCYWSNWDDQVKDGVYVLARGWWFRLGRDARGPGLAYRNIRNAGYNPLFSERYGLDRSVSLRIGSHMWKFLRPLGHDFIRLVDDEEARERNPYRSVG